MIQENLQRLREEISSRATMVAVSKYHAPEEILKAYKLGQRIFAENHVQDMVQKHMDLPSDIQWHMIGHLQTNKVSKIAPFVSMIESVDSMHLLQEIDRQAAIQGRIIPCLLEIRVAREETKTGMGFLECLDLLSSEKMDAMRNVRIDGLMAMASNTSDVAQVRKEFREVHSFFEFIRSTYCLQLRDFRTLSMGMSSDYRMALEEGSNMVRIGSALFGARHEGKIRQEP